MEVLGLQLLLSTVCLNETTCVPTYDNDLFAQTPGHLIRRKRLEDEINGQHLIVGTVNNYPLSYTEEINGTLYGRGIAFQFVDILSKKFNFSYEVVIPKHNLEGAGPEMENSLLELVNKSKTDNRIYNGFYFNRERISKKSWRSSFRTTLFTAFPIIFFHVLTCLGVEVHFAAAFLPVLTYSRHIVTFSTALDEGVWVMMMKRPRESAVGSGLLAPFDVNVWYLILTAVITFGPFIYILTWVRYLLTKDELNKPYKMSPCIWFVYGALIKQGTTMQPDANSTRILFATWWLFITLLSAFYTANLTAFLTLSKFTLAIQYPDDLYKKNYHWVARKGTAVDYVISNPPDDTMYYLNQMVARGRGSFSSDVKDASFLNDVLRGHVFIRDKPAVDHLMYDDYLNKTRAGIEEKDRCTYVITTDPFMTLSRAFAFPNNSTLPYLFDGVILSLVEAGIVKHRKIESLPANTICPLNLKSKERRLRNSDLSMTYCLAGVGIGFAGLIFIVEFCYRLWKQSHDTIVVTPLEKVDINKTNKQVYDDSQPPPYQSIFHQPYGSIYDGNSKRKHINGRDYWVINMPSGDVRLIPVRAPSAFLFQYSS